MTTNNVPNDRKRIAKINAIRDAARARLGMGERCACPTCGRPAGAPYFRADARGHAVEGCVDAFHGTAVLVGEQARWFRRPAAQEIRRAELVHLESL